MSSKYESSMDVGKSLSLIVRRCFEIRIQLLRIYHVLQEVPELNFEAIASDVDDNIRLYSGKFGEGKFILKVKSLLQKLLEVSCPFPRLCGYPSCSIQDARSKSCTDPLRPDSLSCRCPSAATLLSSDLSC